MSSVFETAKFEMDCDATKCETDSDGTICSSDLVSCLAEGFAFQAKNPENMIVEGVLAKLREGLTKKSN